MKFTKEITYKTGRIYDREQELVINWIGEVNDVLGGFDLYLMTDDSRNICKAFAIDKFFGPESEVELKATILKMYDNGKGRDASWPYVRQLQQSSELTRLC